ISSAKSVAGETNSVRVRKIVAARCHHARNKKREPVQSLIFLNSSKGAQGGSGKSIGDLRLSGLNQWRCGCDFQGSGSFADNHFDRTEATVFSSGYDHVRLRSGLEVWTAHFDRVGPDR